MEWVVGLLKAVGSDPDGFPPEFLAAALPLVPVVRRGRPAWDSRLPLAELAAAPFPKLVVSGGHSAGFEAMCDDLGKHIGASRAVVSGAGREIQFTGKPLNEALLALWRIGPGLREGAGSTWPISSALGSTNRSGTSSRSEHRSTSDRASSVVGARLILYRAFADGTGDTGRFPLRLLPRGSPGLLRAGRTRVPAGLVLEPVERVHRRSRPCFRCGSSSLTAKLGTFLETC